jgi:hypothetical protein
MNCHYLPHRNPHSEPSSLCLPGRWDLSKFLRLLLQSPQQLHHYHRVHQQKHHPDPVPGLSGS